MFSVKQEVLYAALSPLDHSHTYAHTSKMVASSVLHCGKKVRVNTMILPMLIRDMLIPEKLSVLGFDVKKHLHLLNEQVQGHR